jgi:hypothetical protein
MNNIPITQDPNEVIDFWVQEYNLLKSKYNLLSSITEDMYLTLTNEIGPTQVSKNYQQLIQNVND